MATNTHQINETDLNYWSNFPDKRDKADRSSPPRYVSFSTLLPKDGTEMWVKIKMVRNYAKALRGTRICYERMVTFSHSDRLGEYELVVPRIDETDILSLEGIGIELDRDIALTAAARIKEQWELEVHE